MFRSKVKPKSVQSPSKPKGTFWTSFIKTKSQNGKNQKGNGLAAFNGPTERGRGSDFGSDDESGSGSDDENESFDGETTISTIHIDEQNNKEIDSHSNLYSELEKDSTSDKNSQSLKLLLPEVIQTSSSSGSHQKSDVVPLIQSAALSPNPPSISNGSSISVKAWASPSKRFTLPTVPLQKVQKESDENSTDFEIHLADSSLLVQQSSDIDIEQEDSEKSSINGQIDFLPTRSQIPRSPIQSKLELVEESFIQSEGFLLQKDPFQATLIQTEIVNPLPLPTQEKDNNHNIELVETTLTKSPQSRNEMKISSEEYEYKSSIQDILHEYEARLDFAKQESRNYIISLREDLDIAEKRLAAVEEENEKLYSICSHAESRKNIATDKFNELLLEYEQLQQYCKETESNFKPLMEENIALKKAMEEMENDLELLSARLDHEKKQSLKQEADFELFSKKIKSQRILISELQDEKDRLQASLRKAQYDPPTESTDIILQKQLNQSLFDIEALKLLVLDLTAENDRLKNGQETARSSPIRNPSTSFSKRATSPTKIPILSESDKWALPSESERSAFLKKMKEYENEARIPSVVSPVPSQYTTASSSRIRLPSKELRDFVKDNQSDFEDDEQESSILISERDQYYQRKNTLESALRNLESEKKKLTFELSRIPRNGAKALRRQNELETMLDNIDREMASIRKKMKDFGLF